MPAEAPRPECPPANPCDIRVIHDAKPVLSFVEGPAPDPIRGEIRAVSVRGTGKLFRDRDAEALNPVQPAGQVPERPPESRATVRTLGTFSSPRALGPARSPCPQRQRRQHQQGDEAGHLQPLPRHPAGGVEIAAVVAAMVGHGRDQQQSERRAIRAPQPALRRHPACS